MIIPEGATTITISHTLLPGHGMLGNFLILESALCKFLVVILTHLIWNASSAWLNLPYKGMWKSASLVVYSLDLESALVKWFVAMVAWLKRMTLEVP